MNINQSRNLSLYRTRPAQILFSWVCLFIVYMGLVLGCLHGFGCVLFTWACLCIICMGLVVYCIHGFGCVGHPCKVWLLVGGETITDFA